jgi:S1-C subfamily serine protease
LDICSTTYCVSCSAAYCNSTLHLSLLQAHELLCRAGINTAIYSPSGASAGVGFAVPIDVLRSSVNQIIQHGRVIRPILGIAFAPEQSVEQVGAEGPHLETRATGCLLCVC